jgi:hypothetical protein
MEFSHYGGVSMEVGFSYRCARPDRFARKAFEYMNPPADVVAGTSNDDSEERGCERNITALESVSNP